MPLTDIAIKTAKPKGKQYKLSDAQGLYLLVKPNGSKYWRMKYRFLGKEKSLALGVYPQTSLKEVREKLAEARKILEGGNDPSELKKQNLLQKQLDYASNFEALAREWHAHKIHSWSPVHAERIIKRLEADVFPSISNRPIRNLTAPEVLAAVRKVEARGNHDLAHRALQHIGQIFRYAVATGRAERDVTSDLRGALKPAKSKTLAYLSEKQLPTFLAELKQYDTKFHGQPLTKLAFQFMIMTFVRSSEIRCAKWDEINWEKAEWRIPAERMKMKEQHIVPLAKQSITLLQAVDKISGDSWGGYIFPSQKTARKMMSENTFLKAIDVMGYKGKTTGHGFRSTASTILNENGFRADVIERQLAHGERNQIRAAYNHAEYLQERREMMQWWADYLERLI